MQKKNLRPFYLVTNIVLALAGSVSALAQPSMYVSGMNNTVQVINSADDTLNATIPVAGTAGGLAVTPDGAYVYVTLQTLNSVTILSTASRTVAGTIPVGM